MDHTANNKSNTDLQKLKEYLERSHINYTERKTNSSTVVEVKRKESKEEKDEGLPKDLST